MSKLLALAALAGAAALTLAACGGGTGVPAALELASADSGRTIGLAPGQAVQVTLESNASTGYRWNVVREPDAAVLRLVSSEYVEPAGSDAVGVAGTEVWRFEAVAPGTASLTLSYARPFQPDSPAGAFQLTVEVA